MSIIATITIKKPKVRKVWAIKPVTKVKESKKIYTRKKKPYETEDRMDYNTCD